MSDNAGLRDPAETQVHPPPTPPTPTDPQDDTINTTQTAPHVEEDPLEDIATGNDAGDVLMQYTTGDMLDEQGGEEEEEGFDPATLANLAALSRIVGDEDEDEGDMEDQNEEAETLEAMDVEPAEDYTALLPAAEDAGITALAEPAAPTPPPEGERIVSEGTRATGHPEEAPTSAPIPVSPPKRDTKDLSPTPKDALTPIETVPSTPRKDDGDTGDEHDERDDGADSSREGSPTRDGDGDGEDEEYPDPKYVYQDGKLKRKRNRTVLSCTECHRRCDRNIPCNRCIKRGVPSMCRMETPVLPERKKRKLPRDTPLNQELGVRVRALESLIRTGSSLDPDSASTAALETILHATRAAEGGSADATSALAQLTESATSEGGIGSMSQDAQSTLLMDVLQQLSIASAEKKPPEPAPKATGTKDIWSSVVNARPDAYTRVNNTYAADVFPNKINLSLPGFREDNGRLFIPPTVRYVEKQMRNENFIAAEALPVWGDEKFLEEGVKFAYGPDHVGFKRRYVSATQANSLTGALRLAATFLARFPAPRGKQVFIPTPTNEDDTATLRDAGLEVRHYRFLNRNTGAVDFEELREDLLAAPPKSVVLLHISGTVPTGAELTAPQWRLLTTILQERNLIPLVIMAFQGLASGDTARDAQPLRLMAHEGLPVVTCQVFDAMMGIYSDSPAIVSVVTKGDNSRDRVTSQMRSIARSLHSHPSPWGAHIAKTILSDPKLHPAWLAEIKAMSDRLRSVREKLYDLLANKFKTPGSWIHLKKSTGMYCTTLLTPQVNEALTVKRHVYLLPHGSFSLGCLNAAKIEFLARSIDAVVLVAIREAEEAQAQQLAMELADAAAREEVAREEAEAAAEAAREEDQMLMERSIQTAIEAQRRAEEDENRREEEERGFEDAVRKAAERAETARQAEAILATITAGQFMM